MAVVETMGLNDIYPRGVMRRPEPGEDFEDLLLPSRVESPPARRVPGNGSPDNSLGSYEGSAGDFGLRRIASETLNGYSPARSASTSSPKRMDQGAFTKLYSMHRDRLGCFHAEKPEVPDSPSSQALAAMIERLHDEEVRKREERKAARTFEREQELCRQTPFVPTLSRASRCTSEPGERHLVLYDQRLELAQRRRQRQEQKLREERDYREAHSVHRARSPQANPMVYQRPTAGFAAVESVDQFSLGSLHEDAELKRRQRRGDVDGKVSPARRVASERQLKLYEQAVEAAQKRRALQQEKLQQEQLYLEANSVHRARSPQADVGVISQRLYEEGRLKKIRQKELQREQELKDVSELAAARKKPTRKDEAALVERLFRPERRQRQHLREEEEEWLQQRRRVSLPQRAASFQGRFHSPVSTPAESPKASSEATPSSSPTAHGPVWGSLRDPPGGWEVNVAAAVHAAELLSANVEQESKSQPSAEAHSAQSAQGVSQEPEAVSEKRRLSLELEECF
ncbi:unnamed protein product [Symbiodinium natans]|uniref:Uncharacterized protein n=1 Tax=Symbiodinium natans TaxID=878477 RepID=A0A812TBR0_9DINO|nr:unnamed protein product [Symbiodinium natans]